MDQTTMALIQAIDMLLGASQIGHTKDLLTVYRFEEGSEIHCALIEALTDAKLTIGIEDALTEKMIAQAV